MPYKSWKQQRKEGSSSLTKNSRGSIECHVLCGSCSARGEMFRLPKSAVKLWMDMHRKEKSDSHLEAQVEIAKFGGVLTCSVLH